MVLRHRARLVLDRTPRHLLLVVLADVGVELLHRVEERLCPRAPRRVLLLEDAVEPFVPSSCDACVACGRELV